MSKATIIYLIKFYCALYGVDPRVAINVARHESNFKVNAIGSHKEIGIFQVRPEYVARYTRKQLFDPEINIRVGIQKLAEAKRTCIHKKDITYLVCYNIGNRGAKKIHHPTLFPYVVAVNHMMKDRM